VAGGQRPAEHGVHLLCRNAEVVGQRLGGDRRALGEQPPEPDRGTLSASFSAGRNSAASAMSSSARFWPAAVYWVSVMINPFSLMCCWLPRRGNLGLAG
jgi:hypothetical protein